MKFIVISHLWGINVGIGSLRPMKITKYLLAKGHEIVVICGDIDEAEAAEDNDLKSFRINPLYSEIKTFGYSGIFKRENSFVEKRIIRKKAKLDSNKPLDVNTTVLRNSRKNTLISVIKKVLAILYDHVYMPLKFYNSAKAAFFALKDIERPDVILSSYEPLSVTFLGKMLKVRFPDSVWISDFRDQIPRPHDPRIFKYFRRHLQKYLCNQVDSVTIVSNTWKQAMKNDGIKNVYWLSSGFDRDDFKQVVSSNPKENFLVFTYTGNLYKGKYDITPLVKCLKRLIKDYKVDGSKLSLVYAGKHSDEFLSQTIILQGLVEIECHGFVSRDRALRLQGESDILVHSAWSNEKDKGIMTGKIYEYMLANKPIISTLAGNEIGSDLSKMIREANLGFVLEGNHENLERELDDFVLKLYEAKFKNDSFPHLPDYDYINRFDYDIIVDQLMVIIENVSKDRFRFNKLMTML